MASPDAQAAVSFETPTSILDDRTPRQTPCPRAASTTVHQNVAFAQKLYESLAFSTPPNDDADQSSLGILSCNFDASLMNLSNNASASVLLSRSRKHSTLPSIPESPNKMPSPCTASEVVANDDVFEDDKQMTDQKRDENKESANRKSEVRFSISDFSKIEFRDDQISARSSTADSYLLDKSLPSTTNGTKPGTFSHLFSMHSLDVSAFTDALPATISSEGTLKANTGHTAVVVANADSHVQDIPPEDSKPPPDEDADLNYFKQLGGGNERFDNISTHSDEFVSGGNFLAVLEKDEEDFNKDNELLIPENAFGNSSVFTPDPANEAALHTSWLSAVNRQDITRPSWFSIEENVGNASRISIGEFIRARTESLGIGPDETALADVERPNFGVPLPTSPKNFNGAALATVVKVPKPTTMAATSRLPQMGATNESVMSSSAISLLLSDVPINYDRHDLANRLMQAVKAPTGSRNLAALPAPTWNARTRHNEASIDFSASILPGMSDSIAVVPKDAVDKSMQAYPPPHSAASRGGGDERSCSSKISIDSCCSSGVGLKPLRADQQDFWQCVSIPSEVTIDTPCCVETSAETAITLNNFSPCWLEGSVRLLRLTCDKDDVNVGTQPPIVRVDSSWAMEPNAPHSLKVVVVPTKKGRWKAQLQLFFRHLAASYSIGATDKSRWCPFPPVVLKLTAEDAVLSTTPGEALDFGLLPEECLAVSHILVENGGEAQLPLRLVIEGSSSAGQGFYFPQENLNNSSILRGSSSCISRCVLGKNCSTAKIPVAFKAPALPHTGNGIQTVSASLRIELEIPGPAPTLKKVALKAFVSPVRLCTLPEDETIQLTYPAASSRRFPLANAGAIPLNLELLTDAPQELTVAPANAELMPGQEIQVQLLYHPADPVNSMQSFLKIKVIPEGSVYKITVVGNPHCRPASALSFRSGGKSLLQSNRRYVYWGAVGLGEDAPQQFALLNVSQTESLFLYLKIKPDDLCGDVSPFQLVDEGLPASSGTSSSALPGCRLVSHCNVTLSPLESRVIKMNFAPKSPAPYSALLVIRHRHVRQHGGASTAPRLKFHIPLRGFGGVAVLAFDGLQQTKMPTTARINVQTSTGQHTIATSEHNSTVQVLHCEPHGGMTHFVARNCGHRTAFVKIVASSDKASIVPLPDWLSVIIQPSEFVLEQSGSCPVKVSVQPHTSSAPFFYLVICYGENVLRHRFGLLPLPLAEHPEDVLLRTQLKLHENFLSDVPPHLADASRVNPQWPACQADRTQLIASLKIQWVLVQPTFRDSPFLPPSLRLNSASDLVDSSSHNTFFPLEAEVTFSDITVLHNTNVPSSPPSKETPASSRANEGTIIVEPTSHTFPSVICGQSSKVKVTLKSKGFAEHVTVNILHPSAPFMISYKSVSIKPNHYLSVPVEFHPTIPGIFSSTLLFYPCVGTGAQTLAVSLQGEAV